MGALDGKFRPSTHSFQKQRCSSRIPEPVGYGPWATPNGVRWVEHITSIASKKAPSAKGASPGKGVGVSHWVAQTCSREMGWVSGGSGAGTASITAFYRR